ncbi:MAG: TolC family outer membrane protein [Alphaproteobacteria bacterium]|nr:TolC family outer membrane protein [Alphaproteobacteria bacterium]
MKRHIFLTGLAAVLFLSFPRPVFAESQSLEQALATAYQNNPALQAERAKLRAADEQVSQALSGYRPTVDATAEAGKSTNNISGNGPFSGSTSLDPRDVGINVTQPVFRGFRTVAGVRSADATVKAQRAALQDAEQQLLLDSGKAFLDVVQAQAVLTINRNNEEVLQKQLNATKDRFRVGELKKTDVSQAESRLKSAMVSRLQAEGDLSNQRTTFSRLIGDMPGTLEQPKLTLEQPKTQDEAVTLSLHKNPSVLAATYSTDAARADITAAEGSLLPEVSIVGSGSRGWQQSSTVPDRQDSATILARVTIPLYRAGTDYSKARAAQQTTTQRRLELENARSRAREGASNSWQSLMTARNAIAGRKEVVAATADALVGVREEAKVGTRTTLDVLNAEQELLDAKLNLAKAEHDEALAILQIKSAIGELTAEAMHLPVNAYDPVKHYDEVRGKWAGLGNVEER